MSSPFIAINPPLIGSCEVCDTPSLLKVLDKSTGIKVGDCCLEFLAAAHRDILCAMRHGFSVVHPGMTVQ